ncbi:MAG: hypothetical protein RhofKO_30130 [Rhodothermales bacterium]
MRRLSLRTVLPSLLLVLLAVALGVMLAGEADLAERLFRLRYLMLLTAAVIAIAVPHVLLPDTERGWMQLLNTRPAELLRRLLKPWGGVLAGLVIPGVLLFFWPPAAEGVTTRLLYTVAYVCFTLGVGLYSFQAYLTLGATSQAWQEGTQGGWFAGLMANSSVPIGVPRGLVPALLLTGRVFLVAIVVMLAVALAGRMGLAWIPALLFLGYVLARLTRLAPRFDRHYYHTNAFYAEIFRSSGSVRASDREPLPFAALYWVPMRWRTFVWAMLRQLDRRLPIGRSIALGHLLLWTLFYQDADPAFIQAYLLAFALAQNLAIFLTAQPALAPAAFQLSLQSPLHWGITRMFINLRWALPWVLSLLVIAWADTSFTYAEVWPWVAYEIVLALVTAALATFRAEVPHRKRYA